MKYALMFYLFVGSIIFPQNTSVPAGFNLYAPSPVPDRVVLSITASPSTSISVNWRTDTTSKVSEAQIAPVSASPALERVSKTVSGSHKRNITDNGVSFAHSVTFNSLLPNTPYAYRVRGKNTWSEWFQFKTASEAHEPFSFLYFGDAQNAIKSLFSRMIRQAFKSTPEAALMIHAGDLVNSRDGNHDDEWGEWCEAGSWLNGMIPNLPTSGNHEFIKKVLPGNKEVYELSPTWFAHFSLPQNGPKGLEGSVYFSDYQGVRFVVLNSQSALDGTAEIQAKWLETILKNNTNRWTIAVYHHPMFSVSQGRDNELLRKSWKPLFDKYGVDMALQGHDHTYGRHSTNLGEGKNVIDKLTGTVYVVSVAGPKMYLVSDKARSTMRRVGEDTQLYQIISVSHDRLVFESRMPDGGLYDGFTLVKQKGAANRIMELLPEERGCSREFKSGEERKRCWSGDHFNQ